MFKGNDADGAEIYDSKEEALERAKMLQKWSKLDLDVMVQREWAPGWFAHLVKMTPFEFLAYRREKNDG